MSTATANALEEKKSRTFEIIKRQNTNWLRKGTERSDKPIQMNTSATHALSMKSRVYRGPGKGYYDIQYVIGANTIFVKDYVDSEGKIAPGLESQKYDLKAEYEKSVGLGIKFEFGLLSLDKFGDDPILEEYVRHHENNIEAPNAESKKDRTVSRMFLFRSLQEEKKAEKRLVDLDSEKEAMDIVFSLRSGSQAKGYTYDVAKMDALLRLLGIGAGLTEADSAQKLEVILHYSKSMPKEFVSIITEETNAAKSAVIRGLELKVISIDKGELKFTHDKRTLLSFAKSTKDDNITEAVYHFIALKGNDDYAVLREKIEEAKAATLK